jgi:hypothetical protein
MSGLPRSHHDVHSDHENTKGRVIFCDLCGLGVANVADVQSHRLLER